MIRILSYDHRPAWVSITRQTTESAASSSRQGDPAETEASLRENLRAQIDGAQAELAANLAQLRNSPNPDVGLIAKGDAQLGALMALARQLDSASPVALAMMRAAVAASAAASSTLAQQASAATSAAQGSSGPSLATASAEARSAVSAFERDMYERKIFDPYLKFTSEADEEAYRKREAERLAETKKAEAEHTPQSDLHALRVSLDQLKDAGAHGATASPQFQTKLTGLNAAASDLTQQIDARAPEHTAQAPSSRDSADRMKPAADVSPDLIAALRNAGVVVADQTQAGHGIVAGATLSSVSLGRG